MLYLVELAKSLRRWRTWALMIVFCAIPALIVVGVLANPPVNGEGPPFLRDILRSGLFAPLTALAVLQPFFLPLAASLFSGDAIAGEASAGTLRYLLAQPAGRVRLVVAKYLSAMTLVLIILLGVVAVGTISGGWAFGLGRMPMLSGSTLSGGAAFIRLLGATLYVALGVSSLAAIGIFISTLTESAPAATVSTVVFAIVSQILGALSSLHAIHPYLLTRDWFAFGDLFRDPVSWEGITHGLIVDASYVTVFLGTALFLFRRKDITS